MIREKLDNWQRIEAVIRWANMTVNYFALHIGLPRGENLYQIKKGNNGISRNLADKIVQRFPEVSLSWLLTGEGKMFADKSHVGGQVPFYKVDVQTHLTGVRHLESDYELWVPQLSDCELAMLSHDKAMDPVVPQGSIVFLKKIAPGSIIPGLEYVVVSQKIVTLRIIRTAEQSDEWRLVAADRERYDDLFVKTTDIEAVYRVAGVLDIKI